MSTEPDTRKLSEYLKERRRHHENMLAARTKKLEKHVASFLTKMADIQAESVAKILNGRKMDELVDEDQQNITAIKTIGIDMAGNRSQIEGLEYCLNTTSIWGFDPNLTHEQGYFILGEIQRCLGNDNYTFDKAALCSVMANIKTFSTPIPTNTETSSSGFKT